MRCSPSSSSACSCVHVAAAPAILFTVPPPTVFNQRHQLRRQLATRQRVGQVCSYRACVVVCTMQRAPEPGHSATGAYQLRTSLAFGNSCVVYHFACPLSHVAAWPHNAMQLQLLVGSAAALPLAPPRHIAHACCPSHAYRAITTLSLHVYIHVCVCCVCTPLHSLTPSPLLQFLKDLCKTAIACRRFLKHLYAVPYATASGRTGQDGVRETLGAGADPLDDEYVHNWFARLDVDTAMNCTLNMYDDTPRARARLHQSCCCPMLLIGFVQGCCWRCATETATSRCISA